MGERTGNYRVFEGFERLPAAVVPIKAGIGGYPHIGIAAQHIGHEQTAEYAHGRSYLFAHQPVASFFKPIETTVDIGPHLPVALHIFQHHIGRIRTVTARGHIHHIAPAAESEQEDAVARDEPYPAERIGIDSCGRSANEFAYISVAANGDNGPQRLEVGHTDSFIVGRPKTLESIFTDTPAGITVDGYATDSLKPVAVIAHESAPIGGNPDESETVGKDIIDMIFGQAGFDVEVGHIVLAAHALSHSLSTGNRNRQYRQQQNDKMLHSTSTLII